MLATVNVESSVTEAFVVTATDREELLRRSEPMIRRIARSVASQSYGQTARDFVDDASTIVWLAMQRVDQLATATFGTWCWTVLRNAFYDRCRRLRSCRDALGRCRTGSLPDMEPAVNRLVVTRTNALAARIAEIDRRTPFSSADESRALSWTPLVTVVLLGSFELWPKLSSREWDARLQSLGVQSPFPTARLSRGLSFTDNVQTVATTLGRNVASVRRLIQRNLERLQQLDCVKNAGEV